MLHAILSRILHKIAWVAPGGGSVRPWIQKLRGVNIGHNVWIGQMVYLDELHPESLTIGDNCTIGLRTSIFTHIYWGSRKEDNPGNVIIEKNVYVGPHCVILPNVRIGEGAVIKAGTVVTRNVPAHSFFGPPPAQVLGEVTVTLTSEHTYEEFLRGMRVRKR